MSHFKTAWGLVLSLTLVACASAHPAASGAPTSAETPPTEQQLCAGLPADSLGVGLCLDSKEIVGVERIPLAQRQGDVLTGARVMVRAAPGRDAGSLQREINCQLARLSRAAYDEQRLLAASCPLAVRRVTAQVGPAAGGWVVEIRPEDAAASHQLSHGVVHARTAVEFERFASAQCSAIEPKARAACPMLGPVASITDLPGGVRVEFPRSASVDSVLARMRCHYDFAEAHAFSEEAAACPLYVRGLRLERAATGRGIDITVSAPDLVKEVQKRAREDAVFAPGT